MKVLVVDDNPDLARSSALLLGLGGHDVRAAETGRAALAVAAEFRPDVILLDLWLPDLDGAEVARGIRAELGNGVLVFAISGLDIADRPPTEPGLYDRQFVKPFDLAEFDHFLNHSRPVTQPGQVSNRP